MTGRPPHRCLGYEGYRCPALITHGSRCKACRNHIYGAPWNTLSTYVRQYQTCDVCGTRQDLVVHHVLPTSTTAGLQVLCRACHNRRHAAREIVW
jgi:hypothetical protein